MTKRASIAIITGGRNYRLTEADYGWLDQMLERYGFTIVLHGDATGADLQAAEWGRRRGLCDAGCAAQWEEHRRRFGRPHGAGPERNRRMGKACAPPVVAVCLAFPGGRGTADMCRQCKRYDIEVLESPR